MRCCLAVIWTVWVLGSIAASPLASAQQRPGDGPAGRRPPMPPRPPEGVKAQRDIAYVEGGNRSQSLDLYLPEQADKPLPLIIWIHGGAWISGDKAQCPAVPFSGQGYAVASLNYRLSGEAVFPAQIQDCKAAVRFLRASARKYNLDPDHFGAWGSSAGGHLVALLGTSGQTREFDTVGGFKDASAAVQAVCDWFGPTDLTRMAAQAIAESRIQHDAPTSPESRLVGGPIQENKDKARRANPITYISKSCPPFMIMHGTKDPIVPFGQSELLYQALQSNNTPVMFQPIPNAQHGGPGFNRPEVTQLVRLFFDKHLQGADVTLQPLAQ